MSSLLESAAPSTVLPTSPSTRIRATMAPAKLSFTWLGTRKSLTAQQRTQAAHSFGAEGKFLTAAKKLLDTSHPAYQEVNSIRHQAQCYWKEVSLPFPEPGIRLIRQVSINEFSNAMESFSYQLRLGVEELDRHYEFLRQAARDRLGELFNPSDYPPSLIGMFSIEHSFPSVEAPNYLRQLNPELYEQECERVKARFDEAVQLAEQAFVEELSKLVNHLNDRLAGADDGKPKVFRDSVITNLHQFFERFQSLNIRSNEQLDQLVHQAQAIVGGVKPQQLREDHHLRQQISTDLSTLQTSLDDLLIDRPRRNIQRPGRQSNGQ